MTANILTVDDSVSMRLLLSATLSSGRYQVAEACDGVEALEYAGRNKVDLVLADVNMPRMDGITLVSNLRSLAGYRDTPILMLTTESGADLKAKAKQAGATGWIVKPFNPSQLLNTVAKVLAAKAQ
jgi:two-component system, chemotaxis family, chemotaxis protein CheY